MIHNVLFMCLSFGSDMVHLLAQGAMDDFSIYP